VAIQGRRPRLRHRAVLWLRHLPSFTGENFWHCDLPELFIPEWMSLQTGGGYQKLDEGLQARFMLGSGSVWICSRRIRTCSWMRQNSNQPTTSCWVVTAAYNRGYENGDRNAFVGNLRWCSNASRCRGDLEGADTVRRNEYVILSARPCNSLD